MRTSRPPIIFAVLTLALSLALGAGCASGTNGTTTGGAANGSGNGTGATGTNGASGGPGTGTNTGSATGAGANGTSTGQDPIGTKCSKTGNAEYQSCATSLDCACPLLCGLDPVRGEDDAGGSICVAKCTTTADCPEIFTSCQNGLCTINICEADGGGGPFMGPCDAEGQGDGTCEPTVAKPSDIIGACIQSGTVDVDAGTCDPNQAPFVPLPLMVENTKRPPKSVLCPIGYACVGNAVGNGGHCEQLCDPVFDGLSEGDAGGCADGKDCVAIGPETMYGGYCTFQGDGGCVTGDLGAGELATCTLDSDCECPYACKVDLGSLRHSCEQTCTDTIPPPSGPVDGGLYCDQLETSCQRLNGAPCDGNARCYCNYNYCVQNYFGYPMDPLPDAGKYGGRCNYAGVSDGICQVGFSKDPFGNPLAAFGYCEPSGTVPVGGSCGDPPFCGLNEICASNGGAPPVCWALCDPGTDAGSGCADGDGCFTISPALPPFPQPAGVCIHPCAPATTGCINSSECCDGFCAWAAPDAGGGFCN